MIIAHVRGHGSLHETDESRAPTWFFRLDSRAKILGIFAFVIVAALLTIPEAVALALVSSLLLALVSRVPARSLTLAYATALPFIALASISVFLFSGWERGVTMLARTSSCVIPLLVLALGTETFDLFTGLRRLMVPALITTLLMLTFRLLLLLSDEFDRMKISRKARGFRGGKSILDRYGFRVLSSTAGMVLVRTSARADRVYEGLRCKAFRRDMVPWRTATLRYGDAAFLLCLIIASATLAAAQMEVIL